MSSKPQEKPPDDSEHQLSLSSTVNDKRYSNILKKNSSTHRSAVVPVNLDNNYKWETFVLTLENADGNTFRGDNLRHVDIYDIAMRFGFKEHEVAGANPRFSHGHACFYSRYPIDVRSRINELKGSQSLEVKNIDGSRENVTFRLKGIDKIHINQKKKITLTLINTFKRVNEIRLVEWLKIFGVVENHYPKRNPFDERAESKYKSYKELWRDGDYMVEMVADPSSIPQILPFEGNLVKVKFSGVRLQCQKCFNFGHLKQHCMEKRLKTSEYERALRQTLQERQASVKITPVHREILALHENEENNNVKIIEKPKEIISSLENVENLGSVADIDQVDLNIPCEVEGVTTVLQSEEPPLEIVPEVEVISTETHSEEPPLDTVPDKIGVSMNISTNAKQASSEGNIIISTHLTKKKNFLEPNLILESRTRSNSSGKRSKPDLNDSPDKASNPPKQS
ncbi:Uncharacterized protein FKW44_011068, partial [Caligus rogercresseyi]